MKSLLNFEFTANKETNSVHVKREFSADLDLVWEAWTNPEILDQWWAPKPYQNKTKSMDFRPGGTWLYSMISPTNEIHWCKAEYHHIENKESYSYTDNFCDEEGTVSNLFPNSYWKNTFTVTGETTTVDIHIQYQSFEAMQQVIEVGFKEGFTMALENLDQFLQERFRLINENKNNTKARVCTYLNFDGKTEEAFLFYKKVFKSEFTGNGLQRFGEIPPSDEQPPMLESIKKMILHVELPITGNHILMGTDAPKEMGFSLNKGNNMHICLEPESREEADRLFNELSENGNVTMPMADMFFGAYFGEFNDKYGINWMINFR